MILNNFYINYYLNTFFFCYLHNVWITVTKEGIDWNFNPINAQQHVICNSTVSQWQESNS